METRRQKHGAVFDSSHLHPVAALLLLSLSESEYTVEPTPSKNSSGLFTSFFPRVLHHARGPSEKLEKRLVTLQPARTCVPGVLVQASQCVFVKLLYNLCSSCRVFFVNLVFFVSLWVFFSGEHVLMHEVTFGVNCITSQRLQVHATLASVVFLGAAETMTIGQKCTHIHFKVITHKKNCGFELSYERISCQQCIQR